MTTLLLAIHISLALASLLFAALTAFATFRHDPLTTEPTSKTMWVFTFSGVVTGFILSFAVHAPLTQTCFSSLALIGAVSMAQLYKTYAFSKN